MEYLSAVVAETLLQFLSCRKYAALDSAERQSDVVGYFIIFIACHMH